MNPLKQAYRALIKHAGGSASGLWEVAVWPAYRDKIKDRYPFNLAATRDASFQDAVAFFKPKSGILWGFYDQFLKPFHRKEVHDFIPEAHLDSRPGPRQALHPVPPAALPLPQARRRDHRRALPRRARRSPRSSSRSTSRP